MQGKRLIRSIKLTNLLSFGPDGTEVELQPLNVLIGANGSGKSNFLEALRLVQAIPDDFKKPIIGEGGTIEDWLWKGRDESDPFHRQCELDIVLKHELFKKFYHYELAFRGYLEDIRVSFEALAESNIEGYEEGTLLYLYEPPNNPSVAHITYTPVEGGGNTRSTKLFEYPKRDIKGDSSIMAQWDDAETNFEIELVAGEFSSIKIYTYASFGKLISARNPQDASLNDVFLFEDASNLALVLNSLQNQPSAKSNITRFLKLFYDNLQDIITRVQRGKVQIFFQEEGLTQTVPATRLSDGTLRYLCLLVILLHPTPPPLICIEEPELGMHPDIIPTIAELLIEASQRTQLIVTTHSDMLVSAIGAKHLEAILVCDRTSKGTTLTRLEPETLTEWLKDYTLGEVWLKGAIGGTRW